MTIRTWALASLCLLAAPGLLAQNRTVYRCPDASGRLTYSDEACKGGQALANDDARSDRERQDAQKVVRREQKLADDLARERRAAAKATPPGGAALIPHSAAENARKDKSATAKAKTGDSKKKPRQDKAKKASAATASPAPTPPGNAPRGAADRSPG